MNSVELLNKLKETEGFDVAYDKYKHMLSSAYIIICRMSRGEKNINFNTVEEAKEHLNSLIEWRIKNEN